MVILFFMFYFLCGHTIKAVGIDFITTKPILCNVRGTQLLAATPNTTLPDPKTTPKECEVIIFDGCTATDPSSFNCVTDVLKTLLSFNKPVILEVDREYEEWVDLLQPDGNAAYAKLLTDYAIANGAKGIMLTGLSPFYTKIKPNGTVGRNVIPFLKQLKSSPDLVIGILINPKYVSDRNDFNYEAARELVDFYMLNTILMNHECKPEVFNGLDPLQGTNGLIGLDSVITDIKKSTIEVDKIFLEIDLMVVDPTSPDYVFLLSSYSDVCSGKFDTCKLCIPTTKDYNEKAKFIHDQKFGVAVNWIQLDDFQNTCGCGPYIGFSNIVAGFKGEPPLSCPKFDIKATC